MTQTTNRDTGLTAIDYARIGERLVGLIVTSAALGHASPAASLMYVAPEEGDLVAAAVGAGLPGGDGDRYRAELDRWLGTEAAGMVKKKIASAVMR